MEMSTDRELSPTREPLLEKPNSPPPVVTPVKQVRRKSSFIRRIDSSDECPSPHDSIYDAHYTSTNNSDESFNHGERIQMVPLRRAVDTQVEITIPNLENDRTIQKADFRYGHGTVLDTISEQKSTATLRTLYRPRSADDMRKLGHKDSFMVAKIPRRNCSFSLDDLHLVEYHEVCHEIYASPKVPIREPVERPSTPPGMPSWTASQTPPLAIPRRPYHIPGTPNRIQRFLGLERFSARVPHPGAVRAVSTPVIMTGCQRAPRFRPPRSAYGQISRHPFNNAPIAPIPQVRSPDKKVHFTPSATARDSSEINLRNAIESTSTSALHPMAPMLTITPMLPIPQTGSMILKGQICMHRKKKEPTSTKIGPIAVQTCLGQTSRHNSVSSTAHMMSGALSPQRSPAESGPASPVIEGGLLGMDPRQNGNGNERLNKRERFVPCWKCVFEKWIERAGRFWVQTASCFCFVCCGYECDDESTVYGGWSYENGSGYFDQDRRYVLEQTPASMV